MPIKEMGKEGMTGPEILSGLALYRKEKVK